MVSRRRGDGVGCHNAVAATPSTRRRRRADRRGIAAPFSASPHPFAGGKPGFYPEIKGKGGPGGHFLLNLWDPFGFTTKRTASLRRPCPHFTPSPRRLLDGVAVRVSHAARWHTGALAPRHDSVKDYRCDRLTRRCTTQAEQKERGLKCEILNGRAAMVGIMGMLSASTVPGSVPFLSGIEGFPQYAGNVMVPFSNDFTLTSMA